MPLPLLDFSKYEKAWPRLLRPDQQPALGCPNAISLGSLWQVRSGYGRSWQANKFYPDDAPITCSSWSLGFGICLEFGIWLFRISRFTSCRAQTKWWRVHLPRPSTSFRILPLIFSALVTHRRRPNRLEPQIALCGSQICSYLQPSACICAKKFLQLAIGQPQILGRNRYSQFPIAPITVHVLLMTPSPSWALFFDILISVTSPTQAAVVGADQ